MVVVRAGGGALLVVAGYFQIHDLLLASSGRLVARDVGG